MARRLASGGLAMATSAARPTSHFTSIPTSPPRKLVMDHRIRHHSGQPGQPPHLLLTLSSRVGMRNSVLCSCKDRKREYGISASKQNVEGEEEGEIARWGLLQAVLWGTEAVYIVWLFLLPYAPGDPIWAISSTTLNELLNLSLNFFFILPAVNSVGIHALESPVCHPMAEGLLNFVIGWTFMFAPLLFTDSKRYRFKGSLNFLWCMQMLLTNVFLLPYMAIRLNGEDLNYPPRKPSQFTSLMTHGAAVVGVIGGLVCLVSLYWCLFGRDDGGFGGVSDRWEFLVSYIGSERLAYAFIWDIVLYSIFQPWLIGDNLQNLKENTVGTVNVIRFIPALGLTAYLLCMDNDKEVSEMIQ